MPIYLEDSIPQTEIFVCPVSGKVNREELQGNSLRGSPAKCYEHIPPTQGLYT
jgi:hypothetical protein